MGFGSFIGGIGLMIIAVLVAVLGFVVLLRFINFGLSFNVPLGIIFLVAALLLFVYGWYLYKSGYPKGTLNVHNQ